MRGRDNRWRRRRRGFRSLAAAIGALGASLVVTSVCAAEWYWAFAAAGFIAFVALTRRALMLWNVDELVFAGGRGPAEDRAGRQMRMTDLSRPTGPSDALPRREAWRT